MELLRSAKQKYKLDFNFKIFVLFFVKYFFVAT